jgi:hypothetical protein
MTDPNKYAFLRQEAKAPYRILRRFFYIAFGVSGGCGGLIALLRLLAGRGELLNNLENLVIQLAVTALTIWLWRKDCPDQKDKQG